MASVVLLQCICIIMTSVTHQLTIDLGSPRVDLTGTTEVTEDVRWELGQLYLTLVGVIAVVLMLVLPSFMRPAEIHLRSH